jgi:hypothetical protein
MNDIPLVEYSDLKTFRGRAHNLYYIQNKGGEVVPFIFTQAQSILDDIVESEFSRTSSESGFSMCKLIILKPRQIGATTYSEVRSFDMQREHSGSNGVIMAHDQDTTDLIYEIYQRLYENAPEYIIPMKGNVCLSTDQQGNPIPIKFRPDAKSQTGKRLAFADNKSRTTISTAGKGDAGGKGVTLRRVHLSEVANYPYYDDLLSSILPSVPNKDGVFIVLESTANGTSGEGEGFYKEWTYAVKEWEAYRRGDKQTYNGFRPVFIPWYIIEEYQMPLAGGKLESIDNIQFENNDVKQAFLDREQQMMNEGIINPLNGEIVKVSPEKINWYRNVIKTQCRFEYSRAQRYYPTTPQDAFSASSHSFFDSYKLGEVKKEIVNDPKDFSLGELVWGEGGEVEFQERSIGNFKVWEHPDKKWTNRYIVGIDPARNRGDGDYGVIKVFDRLTQKYVARWYGKIDQDLFAEKSIEIGLYYNEALLVPESNLDMVITLIKPDGKMPYVGEIYHTNTASTINWGYWTGTNRQVLLDTYKGYLRDNPNGYGVLLDELEVDEHESFIRKENRRSGDGIRYEAAEGAHDDIVFANALCIAGQTWWEEPVKEYKPTKIVEVIRSSFKRKQKRLKQSELGRNANIH